MGSCCEAAEDKHSLQAVTGDQSVAHQDEHTKIERVEDDFNENSAYPAQQKEPEPPAIAPAPAPVQVQETKVEPPQPVAPTPSPPAERTRTNPLLQDMAARGFDVFEVELRMIPGKKLGMGVGYREGEPYPLRVTRILPDGLVGLWNEANPTKEVDIGHHILELNGTAATALEPDKVQKVVASSEILKLVVMRNGPADVQGNE